MLSRLWLIVAILFAFEGPAAAGTLEHRQIEAASLKGNPAGNPIARGITVYLPDGYADATRRFPVLYYLSGFFENDRAPYTGHGAEALWSRAIAERVIGDVIIVTADFSTPAGGSWYVNSPATGNWDDWMVREIVPWVDAHYRTLDRPESRGIAGDRMGGYGAIRFGMRHPDVFGAVYALHPIGTDRGLQTLFSRPDWALLGKARSIEDLRSDGFSLIFTSIFQAFVPNAARAPLFFDPPASLDQQRLAIDPEVTERLESRFFLTRQVAANADNLKRLRGFMFDWGRDDPNADHVVSNRAFTRVLDGFGVPYEAEEYRGGFGDRNWGEGGRIYTEMLPFFARTLVFERD